MSKIDIPTISGLSPSARGLLLVYVFVGEGEPIEKMMVMSGVRKRDTFYEARKELEAAGWVRLERRPGKPPIVTLLHHPSLQSATRNTFNSTNHEVLTSSDLSNRLINRYIDSVGLCENGVNIENVGNGSTDGFVEDVVPMGSPSDGGYQPLLPPLKVTTLSGVPPLMGVSTTPDEGGYPCILPPLSGATLEGVPPMKGVSHSVDTPSDGGYPKSLYDRCLEVDEMDGSGTPQSSTFQAKRRAGIPLVGELWEKFIPGVSLTDADKKRLLGWCDNSLETLHDELEYVAGLISLKGSVEFPRGYALKTIQRRSEERKRSEIRTPLQETRVPVGAAAYREGEPLPEPEPVWLEESLREGEKVMRRLMLEKGWLE